MRTGESTNEYGTPVSEHICDICKEPFTVTPAVSAKKEGWDNCMSPECDSYDPTRDPEKFSTPGIVNGNLVDLGKNVVDLATRRPSREMETIFLECECRAMLSIPTDTPLFKYECGRCGKKGFLVGRDQ